MPPILAHHLIWSTYGFWLPNDERGSWSDEVLAPHLKPFGPATKVSTHESLAGQPFNPAVRQAARDALKYPHVRLTGRQARAVAKGIAADAQSFGLAIYALAIMPDHVHLIVPAHPDWTGLQLLTRLKSAATRRLTAEGLHPLAAHADADGQTPTPWAARGWVRFLHTPEKIVSRIVYVDRNPTEAGLPAQTWKFVTPIRL